MVQDVDWRTWRRAERERLLAERFAVSRAAREEAASLVCARLDEVLNLPTGRIVSFYWPFKRELDLRGWIVGLLERRLISTLPVVIDKKTQMVFRQWDP